MPTHSPDPPTPVSDVPQLPLRAPTTHKGQAGHVAVVAGSVGMSGAAVLTALGALRGGAGLVRVCCPRSVLPIVAASEPCAMTAPLDEDSGGRLADGPGLAGLDLDWPHALAVGPGLGQNEALPGLVGRLIGHFAGPLVIDADGLNNLAGLGGTVWGERRGRPTVLTPHPGEMARLRRGAGLPEPGGQDDETRLRITHEFACHSGATVVLKGHRTVVATATQTYLNTTGNPGMATGGMGDVLTGLIAALLAQGLSPFDAARLGVHVHGLAADHCAQSMGPVGYLARDVAEAIPAALKQAGCSRMGFK